MAAIDLNRLNKDIDRLKENYSQPKEFRHALHDILSFYHRYAHRPTKDALPKSFMRVYDLAPQVTRQIELGLRLTAKEQPEATLALVDELWQHDYFEPLDLAAYLLGQLPASHAAQVKDKILSLLQDPLDRSVVNALCLKGAAALRIDAPKVWESLLNETLESNRQQLQIFGLSGLALDADSQPLEAFPRLYRQVRPHLGKAASASSNLLQEIIASLARRNAQETAFFLKQVLADTDGAAIERQTRQFLPFFNEEIQAGLATSIRNHANRKQ